MTALSTFVKSISGDHYGLHLFDTTVQVTQPTTLKAGTFGNVSSFQPWEVSGAKETLARHPAAIWQHLTVVVSPGAGLHGRVCTFYCAWGSDADPAPKTLADMSGLRDFSVRAYGGTDVPTEAARTFPVKFTDGMSDVLKMRHFPVGGRAIFYYAYVENRKDESAADAEPFHLVATGAYDLYGRK